MDGVESASKRGDRFRRLQVESAMQAHSHLVRSLVTAVDCRVDTIFQKIPKFCCYNVCRMVTTMGYYGITYSVTNLSGDFYLNYGLSM